MGRNDPNRTKWTPVALWSLLIFATVPLARAMRQVVEDTVGRDAFLAVTILLSAAAAAVALFRGRYTYGLGPGRLLALLAMSALFLASVVQLSSSPEEALHFIEYGVLGALAYRTLAPASANLLVYPTAFMVTAIVGQLDETMQWVMPGRYWELRDIGLNVTAAAIVLGAIAVGVGPERTSGPTDARSLRRFVRASAIAMAILALSTLNTPSRIAWYTEKIPPLAFLANADAAMFEYGYYYEDHETGSFKSRLTPEELARADRERGREAGEIIKRYGQPEQYSELLGKYSPVTDPFVHEVRVHLFRRDRYFELALEYPEDSFDRRRCATVSASEQKILEKYFPVTLAHSGFDLDPAQREAVQALLLPPDEHARAIAASESLVSRNLVTRVTEPQLLTLYALVAMVLVIADRRLTRRMFGEGRE